MGIFSGFALKNDKFTIEMEDKLRYYVIWMRIKNRKTSLKKPA